MGVVKRRRVELSQIQGIEDICTHPGNIKGMCIKCGKKILDDNQSGSVVLGYIHKDLRVSNGELLRLRDKCSKKLLSQKKLYLVLDLDHTLLNSTSIHKTTACERGHLDLGFLNDHDSLFRVESMKMITKLRPFVRTFLKEASKLFEMYIYTMGSRSYALEMVKLLDPDDVYFNAKVVAREDCTRRSRKALDVVLGREKNVVIVDDREKAWGKQRSNVVAVRRYFFFASSCRHGLKGKSLLELSSDERGSDGVLENVLEFLKRVHRLFFIKNVKNGDLEDRDVRRVMRFAVMKRKKNSCGQEPKKNN